MSLDGGPGRRSPRQALVVGAASGIGLAAATALAASGFRVTGTWHRTPHPDDIRIGWRRLDVGSGDDRAAFWSALEHDGCMPEVLVYCPAVLMDQSLLRLDIASVTQALETNLIAAIDCARAAAPSMARNRWGRIALIGSAVAQLGNSGQSAYVSSKAGLVGFARTAARELGPRSVTVNVIEPGIVDTRLVREVADSVLDDMRARTPVGRTGMPEEVAEVIRFIVGEEASAITGAQIRVDGGVSVALSP